MNHASVNLFNEDGTPRSPEEVAQDAVHELFHTLRLDHPFESTQSEDTKLIHLGGNNFSSTPTTDPSILFNIMSYSMINIDGESFSENKSGKSQTLLTCGQLDFLLNEIFLQKQGYGYYSYDPSATLEENTKKYTEYYDNYWFNWPGEPIKRK